MPQSRLSVVACILCFASSSVNADELDLAALTCAHDAPVAARWKELERAGRNVGGGELVLDGKFTFGALCVERVSLSAAFGVMVVIASLCDAKPEPLRQFVLAQDPELQPAKGRSSRVAGTIAAYESPKHTFALYKGRVSETTLPDPQSAEVSYMCSYMAAGPQ